jgi:hypothetical protein
MTRAEQVNAALAIIDPPAEELDSCREHVERLLDIVEGAGRAAQHAGVTKKEMAAKRAALKRLLQVGSGSHVAMALSPSHKRQIACQIDWLDHWSPPSPSVKKEYAVAMAYELLSRWSPDAITVSATGKWNALAATLIGGLGVNLYRQLRKFERDRRRNRSNQGSPLRAGTTDPGSEDDPLLRRLRRVR